MRTGEHRHRAEGALVALVGAVGQAQPLRNIDLVRAHHPDDDGDGEVTLVTEADAHRRRAAPDTERGGTGVAAHHLHVAPGGKRFPGAGTPGELAHRLLGGETTGETIGAPVAVGALGGREQTVRQCGVTAQRRLEAARRGDVDAHGRNRDEGEERGHGYRRAYSTVTDLARLRGWSTSQPRSTATW